MSYIYCSDDNHYKLIGNLQDLFEDLVIRPFQEHPWTQPWVDYVINTNHMYHREKILAQGRTNFSEPHNGLPPEDKVSLYCVYYLPMHLFSSYHIFTNYLTSISHKVVFIDFGCGPLTSGIAFWAAARQSDVIYLGIDSSQAMLDKAKEVNEYGPNRWYPFFSKFETIRNYSQLIQLLDNYIERGAKLQIIFNFCYFLASRTLDIHELYHNVLLEIVEKYYMHKISVVYQNPDPRRLSERRRLELHGKWRILKDNLEYECKISRFGSQITQSNIEQFRYDSLIDGSPHNPKVYFDILSNESPSFFQRSI